jgi:hypothetical protein
MFVTTGQTDKASPPAKSLTIYIIASRFPHIHGSLIILNSKRIT